MENCCIEDIIWLMDVRFDFLLSSFLTEFGVDPSSVLMVNSYHGKEREKYKKISVIENTMGIVLMEPDQLNRKMVKQIDYRNKMIVAFTGAGLPRISRKYTFFACGDIAEKCNDKWWQYQFLNRLKIRTPFTEKYYDSHKLESKFKYLLNKYKKMIIKRTNYSGGYLMSVVCSFEDLKEYINTDKDTDSIYLLSEYVHHSKSLASMGIIRENGEVKNLNIITEQVLYNEFAYEGLIYPAFISKKIEDEINYITNIIGNALAQEGYYGFFGVDFILGEYGLYVVEINARFVFGTILVACIYGQQFWKLIRGQDIDLHMPFHQRLIIGKIKGKMGERYSYIKKGGDILSWYQEGKGMFEKIFLKNSAEMLFEYGSFIGIFGEFFSNDVSQREILTRFWKHCLKYCK